MPKLARGWSRKTLYVLKSPEGKRVSYNEYRNRTGLCEGCGEPMASHPRCEACGMLAGQGHFFYCRSYRGHSICGYCQQSWEGLDEIAGQETTWDEFLRPEVLKIGVLITESNGDSDHG